MSDNVISIIFFLISILIVLETLGQKAVFYYLVLVLLGVFMFNASRFTILHMGG